MGSPVFEDGRHSPYGARVLPRMGRPQLLEQSSVQFQPLRWSPSTAMTNYTAHDFDGQLSVHWIFFGQITSELLPSQLAGICISAMFVDPLFVVRRDRNIMLVNFRSDADAQRVLAFDKRVLLDYECVWVGSAGDGEAALQADLAAHRARHLPSNCMTIERCRNVPRYLLTPNGVFGAAVGGGVGDSHDDGSLTVPKAHRPRSAGSGVSLKVEEGSFGGLSSTNESRLASHLVSFATVAEA